MIEKKTKNKTNPSPVVKTLHALQELNGAGTVQTLVDNEIAVQNLTRLAESKGCAIRTEKRGEKEFCVTITTEGAVAESGDEEISCTVPAAQKKTVVVISADRMGEGDDALGRILLKGFLFALTQQEKLPSTLLFYNGGARVTCEGSPSLEDLKNLAALGVEPEDGVLLLQRDIYADGKNICRANGRPITVAQLRALGTSLLNIHGQHEGTQLLDEEQHGAYLDRFARLDGLLEAYTERYQAARETQRQIQALEMDEAERPAASTRCAIRSPSWSARSCAPARRKSFLRGASCCATPKSSWTPLPRRTTPSPAGTTASASRVSSRKRRASSKVCEHSPKRRAT